MHTDSSASFTYFASVSASECTTTVRMPISRHARWMRNAISPRLAIRILPNISAEDEKRLAVFHGLAVLHEDGLDDAGDIRLDLVHELHRLDDADGVALLYRLPDFHEGLGVGRWRPVERPDHGRLDDRAFRAGRGLGGRRCRRGPGGPRVGRRRSHRAGCGRRDARYADLPTPDDLDLLLAFGDLQLCDPRFLNQVDELLKLAQVHPLPAK